MLEALNVFNLIAAGITIITTTVSLVLWYKHRERDKWTYGNYLSLLEGLDRVITFARAEPSKETSARVGDMVVTMRGVVVASLKVLNPKCTDRLRSSEFGFSNSKDKAREVMLVAGELNPEVYRDIFMKMNNDEEEES